MDSRNRGSTGTRHVVLQLSRMLPGRSSHLTGTSDSLSGKIERHLARQTHFNPSISHRFYCKIEIRRTAAADSGSSVKQLFL
jgi:hypothetical protein